MSGPTDPVVQPDPSSDLQLSQQAPLLLSKPAPTSDFFPLSLLKAPETPETWTNHERLFYACLKTGDNKSAHLLLERLTQRFGTDNQRVMALRGLYQEAVADTSDDLRQILEEYNKTLSENPMNVPIHKRRIALVRSMKHIPEAIATLVDFLEAFPTDAEAWCELSDLYQSQGLGAQAIFSLEEALLSAPNAWNLHARLGELEYLVANTGSANDEETINMLSSAVRRFARCVELCNNYLRGYYGMKLASAKLLEAMSQTKQGGPESRETVQRLHDMATEKLQTIVKRWPTQSREGAGGAELIAVQALLNRVQS